MSDDPTTRTGTSAKSLRSQLRPASVGLVLATLTVLFGQMLGIIFGLNEDSIKDRLQASAVEVRESIYHNDDNAIKLVLGKSWTYMQRAHLHAGAMGTTALTLIVLLSLLGLSRRSLGIVSLALGGGGLGYSIFWMWAGFRAPGLGSTGASKESLRLLAMPSSGAFVLGTVAALFFLVLAFAKTNENKNT